MTQELGIDSVKASSAMPGARYVLAVLFVINLVNFFDRQILGAVGEQIRREWGLGDTALGALSTAFTLLYAFVGVPLGQAGRSRQPQAHPRRRRIRLEPADRRVRRSPALLGVVRRSPRRWRRRSQLRPGRYLADRRSLSPTAARTGHGRVHARLAPRPRTELSRRRLRGTAIGMARGALHRRCARAVLCVRPRCSSMSRRGGRVEATRCRHSSAPGLAVHAGAVDPDAAGGSSCRARCTTSTCTRSARSLRHSSCATTASASRTPA